MIPVTQTKVVITNTKGEIITRGNCFAACIASILEVPITEIPNVEVFYHLDTGYWAEVMLTFLESKGWDLCTDDKYLSFHYGFKTIPNINCQDGSNYNKVLELMPDHDDRRHWQYKNKHNYYLVSGKSPRGFNHICIFKEGKLVHDPHPSKEGLTTISNFQTLIKNQPHDTRNKG
jgi:hypothetical protein